MCCDLSGGLAEKGRGLWTVSRGMGVLGNQCFERWAAGTQGTGGEVVRKKHGTREGKTAAAADSAQESGGCASTVRATLLSPGVGAAAPPHIARLPAPSGEGAPEKAGKDAEADCRGTVVGRVYSRVFEVTLLSTQFQHIPGSCRTPTVPHYTCTWASPPEASGSSNGGLLTNLVIFALTSQITADSFLGESTLGAELEPAALGSGHSNFIFNCGRVPSLGESSRQQ